MISGFVYMYYVFNLYNTIRKVYSGLTNQNFTFLHGLLFGTTDSISNSIVPSSWDDDHHTG